MLLHADVWTEPTFSLVSCGFMGQSVIISACRFEDGHSSKCADNSGGSSLHLNGWKPKGFSQNPPENLL